MLPSTKEINVFSVRRVKLHGCNPDGYRAIDWVIEVAHYWEGSAGLQCFIQ